VIVPVPPNHITAHAKFFCQRINASAASTQQLDPPPLRMLAALAAPPSGRFHAYPVLLVINSLAEQEVRENNREKRADEDFTRRRSQAT
jgi:hypothetical protein